MNCQTLIRDFTFSRQKRQSVLFIQYLYQISLRLPRSVRCLFSGQAELHGIGRFRGQQDQVILFGLDAGKSSSVKQHQGSADDDPSDRGTEIRVYI